MRKAIGPTFAVELELAGLTGLPFAWGEDGQIVYGPAMSPSEMDAVQAVYSAHDPTASSAETT